jgi:hypothetical protein
MSYGYISSKWPALLVRGDTLTEAQANEVIVRMTSPWMLSGNDRSWGEQVHQVYGITMDRYGDAYWRETQRVERELGVVPAEYLGLHGRIYTAMIGGSYGWCDWNGTVRGAYNVGKWPSVEELTDQWVDVARAFPFLTLIAQAIDCETCEMVGTEVPVAQWSIGDGEARLEAEPGPMLDVGPVETDVAKIIEPWWSSPTRERGVTIERLQQAVAQVRSTYVPEDDSDDERGE